MAEPCKFQSVVAEVYRLFVEAVEYAAAEAYRREVKDDMPENYPEELALIALAVSEAVESEEGIGRERALELGFMASERVSEAFGGSRKFGSKVYIPKKDRKEVEQRSLAIYGAWKNGESIKSLARRHKLSETMVRTIIDNKGVAHHGRKAKAD